MVNWAYIDYDKHGIYSNPISTFVIYIALVFVDPLPNILIINKSTSLLMNDHWVVNFQEDKNIKIMIDLLSGIMISF